MISVRKQRIYGAGKGIYTRQALVGCITGLKHAFCIKNR